MRRAPRTSRYWLPGLALVALWSGCQSIPASDVLISATSSILAVDVVYPIPMNRDPSLVQVFFVRGPIYNGLEELPEFIPASFVKRSRAYLLDPAPGTYSVVAVTSRLVPPRNDHPVAGGVTETVWSGDIADVMVFPEELIRRTITTVGPGEVAFMGSLRVLRSDRIHANAVYQDDLQQRIAERIRPGVTSESGLAGWFTLTWMVDLENTVFSNQAADRESFINAALPDLDDSPWARVIARAAPREATAASPSTPAPRSEIRAAHSEAAASTPHVAVPDPKAGIPAPMAAAPEPMTATPEPMAAPPPVAATPEPTDSTPEANGVIWEPIAAIPERKASPPEPERRRFTGLPPGSPLVEVEFGMHHDEVRKILGDPDERSRHLTAKAWIPFYRGPGAHLVDWIYHGVGRVVFSLHGGSLVVMDVVPNPTHPN